MLHKPWLTHCSEQELSDDGGSLAVALNAANAALADAGVPMRYTFGEAQFLTICKIAIDDVLGFCLSC